MQRPLIGIAVGLGLSALAHADTGAGAAAADPAERSRNPAPLVLKRSLVLTLAAYPAAGRTLPARRGAMLRLRMDTHFGTFLNEPGGNAPADFPLRAEPVRAPAEAALLEQARFWTSQGREDLAEEALQKLFRISPDNLAGLETLARVQVRRRLPEAARILVARMRRLQPDAPEIARIEALMRIDGTDSDALRQMRQLVREQRYDQAAAAMRTLYPQGPPTEEMTLEYWSMVANAPNGRPRARDGLQALVRLEPENLRYRLALAELLTARAPVDRTALAQLIALTEVPAYAKQARAAWRRAMLALDDNGASVALLRSYLAQEKNDSAVQSRLEAMLASLEVRRRLQADPHYRAQQAGLALLAAGRLDAAQERLQYALATRANEIDLLNGLGLLRLRQRRHAESEALFLRAARLDPPQRSRWQRMAGVARYWGLITQADRASEARRFALAEEKLREARALDPKEPAAVLALAALYLAQARSGDAERSYGEVLGLDPANAGAIEGLARLYLAQGQDERLQRLLARLAPAQRTALLPAIDGARAARLRTQADAQVAAGNTAQAIMLLEEAAVLAPADPWLRYDLARLYVGRNAPGDDSRADRLFAALLKPAAADPAALYAYALLDDNRDRRIHALQTLERIPAGARERKIVELQRRLWVTQRLGHAGALTAAGQSAAAVALLRATAAAAGNDASLTPQIAAALADTGSPDGVEAARLLLAQFDANPDLPADWRLRRAEILARFDDDVTLAANLAALDAAATGAAASAASSVATSAATSLSNAARLADLHATLLTRQVDALLKQGDNAAALALLERSSGVDNRRLILLRADTALGLHQHDLAAAGYRRLLESEPDDRDAGIGLIDSLIGAGESDAARLLIARQVGLRRAAPGGLTADDAASLAARLIDLKEDAAAVELIEDALATAPASSRLLNQAAQLAERGGQPDAAIAYLQRSLAITQDERSAGQLASRSRLRSLPGDDGATAARAQGLPPEPAGVGLRADVSLQRPPDGAAPPLPGPLAPQLQVALGLPPEPPANGSYRRLAELLDSRSTWLAGAIDNRSRVGATGTSEYAYTELPFEVRAPWRAGSHVFAQAAVVRSSAGTLDLGAVDSAARFGSLLLCHPLCTVGGAAQSVRGLALMAGIEQDEWRGDIGVTPLGFPITNIVGGVLKKGDIGAFSYSVDASRRALMGSVLSYAGARDPRTGALFGGVLANGVRFGLSRDSGGAVGAWSALGLHRLTGTDVQANNRMQLMGGAYWRLINEDDRVLTVGMNAMLWRFSENAGEYTLGHGGYYSPQRFASVSLPVAFSARTARLSYTVRAALSASRSSTAAADYFPTRPDLQTQALALAAGNGIDPRYTASTGHGVGRSLSAAFEYQMNPKLYVGGRFEIDRSSDYAPNRLLFYFRYNLDHNGARPVNLPPEPLLPASQY